MDQKEIAMNGAGVAELGFPMWPQFDPKTKQDMADAMDSGLVSYWTGKKGMEFEEKFRQWSGATMAVSCSCGTAALHIGISCLGIGPGDEVLVPSYSFIASSYAIVQAGAIPVFCDVTPDHTIDPDDIERKITDRTKGIVVLEDEMRACCDHLYMMTDDGTYGEKGFTTEYLKQEIEANIKDGKPQFDRVIAIGPDIMMKFLAEVTRPYGIKTIISLDPIMVDGTGMCGGWRPTPPRGGE